MKKATRILFSILLLSSTAYIATGNHAGARVIDPCWYKGFDC